MAFLVLYGFYKVALQLINPWLRKKDDDWLTKRSSNLAYIVPLEQGQMSKNTAFLVLYGLCRVLMVLR